MISRDEAVKIVEEGIANLRVLEPEIPEHIPAHFKQHLYMVAKAAEIIASKIEGMRPETAYIFGLLHDYGKFFGDAFDKNGFHGLVGYRKFMLSNMPELANICLTHTFLKKDFVEEEYSSYPDSSVGEVKQIFQNMEFDKYDRLMQLSDLLSDGPNNSFNNISYRLRSVKARYNVPEEVVKKRFKEALEVKKELELLTNCDIYTLLGVGEDDAI